MMITKTCPMCKQDKEEAAFYKGRSYSRSIGSLSPYCKECTVIKNKESNRLRMREFRKSYGPKERKILAERAKVFRKESKMWNPARWRARKFFDCKYRKLISENVTINLLEKMFLETANCECCGTPLTLGFDARETRDHRSNYKSPSVDRVDNEKPYEIGNIAIVCWQCNMRKTDLTLKDLEMFKTYILKYVR